MLLQYYSFYVGLLATKPPHITPPTARRLQFPAISFLLSLRSRIHKLPLDSEDRGLSGVCVSTRVSDSKSVSSEAYVLHRHAYRSLHMRVNTCQAVDRSSGKISGKREKVDLSL
jgi:hypothetical protein